MPSPQYSPTLADRVAAQTRNGLDVAVEKLAEAIGPPNASGAAEAAPRVVEQCALAPYQRCSSFRPLLLSSQGLPGC